MDAKTLQIYKSKLIQVFQEFLTLCQRHNLNYFCCGGTALGAVRHGGIIPWDDDIDILMPRPDYDKLLEVFDAEGYVLITPSNTPNYYLPYCKMSLKNSTLIERKEVLCNIGIFIDIFPLDGISNSETSQLKDLERFYKNANKIHRQPKQIKYNIKDAITSLKKGQLRSVWLELTLSIKKTQKRKKILKDLDACMRRYEYNNAEYVSNYAGMWGLSECCPKEWFNDYTEGDFEGLKIRLPSNPHLYLSRLYGNYMQLPPIEKRNTHHVIAYLNLDRRLSEEEIKELDL